MCGPSCLHRLSNFRFLRGPTGFTPPGGWAIRELPISDQRLAEAWARTRKPALSPNDAVKRVIDFLSANQFPIDDAVELAIEGVGIRQWCAQNPAYCGLPPEGEHQSSNATLPGAPAQWEAANTALHDGIEDAAVKLVEITKSLAAWISGPEGCHKCSLAWRAYLVFHPPGLVRTLEEARRWLHRAHNEANPSRPDVPYEEIFQKFWADAPPPPVAEGSSSWVANLTTA